MKYLALQSSHVVLCIFTITTHYNYVLGAVFFQSRKRHPLLYYQGYYFTKNRTSNNKQYWKCSKYKSIGCKARQTTINGEIIKTGHMNHHNHLPDPDQIKY